MDYKNWRFMHYPNGTAYLLPLFGTIIPISHIDDRNYIATDTKGNTYHLSRDNFSTMFLEERDRFYGGPSGRKRNTL